MGRLEENKRFNYFRKMNQETIIIISDPGDEQEGTHISLEQWQY